MLQKTHSQTAARIVQLGNTITWLRNDKLRFTGLTATQSEAIHYILRHYEEKELTASDLMDYLQLSQSTVAGIIQRLEQKGMICRTTSPEDNRKSLISPTPKGLELENFLKQSVAEIEAILLQGMTEEEQVEFNRLLQKSLDHANTAKRNGEDNAT